MAKGKNLPVIPATVHAIAATKASSDEQLAVSWVASLNSTHSRRNCERTASRFLAVLGAPLRAATVEDVREALTTITADLAPTSARQMVLRVKSLLSYGHRLGYLRFNAGAVIKVHGDTRSIAQRIVSEVEICSRPQPSAQACQVVSRPIGCATPTRATPSTTALRCQSCRRPSGTAASP